MIRGHTLLKSAESGDRKDGLKDLRRDGYIDAKVGGSTSQNDPQSKKNKARKEVEVRRSSGGIDWKGGEAGMRGCGRVNQKEETRQVESIREWDGETKVNMGVHHRRRRLHRVLVSGKNGERSAGGMRQQ